MDERLGVVDERDRPAAEPHDSLIQDGIEFVVRDQIRSEGVRVDGDVPVALGPDALHQCVPPHARLRCASYCSSLASDRGTSSPLPRVAPARSAKRTYARSACSVARSKTSRISTEVANSDVSGTFRGRTYRAPSRRTSPYVLAQRCGRSANSNTCITATVTLLDSSTVARSKCNGGSA